MAVPVSWAVLRQAEAERGEATPDAAVNVYVLKMSSGEELGLSRVLVAGRHDELLRQWRQSRGEMERARAPSKLETVGPIGGDERGRTLRNSAHVTSQRSGAYEAPWTQSSQGGGDVSCRQQVAKAVRRLRRLAGISRVRRPEGSV
ncbi:hypothetical protein [Micromonospora rhizosphaerae]|uniref:hypothetical protein n=1 Tax=Micromonospora rhizosphaerae TaxID=568872 RepID=UPI000B841B4D|nr:hypothetical protein [Micromonospora rhizosphaerae]